MNLNGQTRRSDSHARNASTIPAPSSDLLSASPEVAAYVRASERVRAALEEQRQAIAALRELRLPAPRGDAVNARRTYDRARYLADLAALDARRAEAPALRVELARQLTSEAELVAPVSMVVPARPAPAAGPARRATVIGVAPPAVVGDRWAATAAVLRELTAPSEPVTERVLRAAGLGARPSGRVR